MPSPRELTRQQELDRIHRFGAPPLGSPFSTKVVGCSFVTGYPNNILALDELHNAPHREEPLVVILLRNPANRYDTNAVEVHVPALGEHAMIGHLTSPMAARLAPELDRGATWSAHVVTVLVHPEHPERPGIEIRCERHTAVP